MQLNNKEKKQLKSIGHHLKPSVQIGKGGIQDTVITTIKEILVVHELIKIRVMKNSSVEVKSTLSEISEKTGSTLVQSIGKVGLFFKRNKDVPKIIFE